MDEPLFDPRQRLRQSIRRKTAYWYATALLMAIFSVFVWQAVAWMYALPPLIYAGCALISGLIIRESMMTAFHLGHADAFMAVAAAPPGLEGIDGEEADGA